MAAHVLKEGVPGINPEILGMGGKQRYPSEDRDIVVSGLPNAARISINGEETILKPGDKPIPIRLGLQAQIRVSAVHDQPDE